MLTVPSSNNNSCNGLPKLISDVVPHILQFCDAKTLSRCACVSRSWRTLANNNELMAFEHEGFWQPMDTLRDKVHLEELWASNDAPWKMWNV